MSVYTTQVRFICESFATQEGCNTDNITDIMDKAIPHIFTDFPIFNLHYKRLLCKKILSHYYFNEIAYETFGLWKFALNSKLNEIMPYYNKLYESELLKFDPLIDTDYAENMTFKGDKTTTDKGTEATTVNVEDLGGNKTRTIDYRGKEQSSTSYSGGESGTTNYSGGETNTTTYTGNESGTTNFTGSENTYTKYSGGTSKTPNTQTYTSRSDTPQGTLSGVVNDTYLTEATKTVVTGSEKEIFNDREDDVTKSFEGRKDTFVKGFENRQDITSKEFDGRKDSYAKEYTNRHDLTIDEYQNRSDIITDTSEAKSKQDINNTSDKTTTDKTDNVNNVAVKGKRGSMTFAEMITKYRDTFLNIDIDVINDLRSLFMTIY